ncbi:MAG: HAD-IA family hydrolase [Gammaproteobacteria bacterium]|nr:HAD-IA family hydrolase [Gammaproteobacteria bacterium]
MPPRPPATHILFDMDGLLLNTEIIYTAVTREIVGRFGKTYDWDLKAQMIGRPALDSARFLVEQLQLPISAGQYLAERCKLSQRAFAACDALPGAERLVRHLHRHRVPMAVATSSGRDLFNLKTARHRAWFDLMDTVVCGDDPQVARGKPAPDIFIAAAARLGADPESTLVFEDSPQGLAAGLAARMRVIAVPDPNMEKSRYAGADLIIDSLPEFAPEAYGLPGISGG